MYINPQEDECGNRLSAIYNPELHGWRGGMTPTLAVIVTLQQVPPILCQWESICGEEGRKV